MQKKNSSPHDIIYGVHPIRELILAKRRNIYTIYTTKPEPKGFKLIQPLLPKRTALQYVTRTVLNNIAGCSEHQGIIAAVSPFAYTDTVCDPIRFKRVALLDNIQDPRNLGAIIRSAYCAHIDGIILTTKATAPISGTVCKASAGLIEYMPIMQVSSAAHAYLLLKKNKYHIYLAVLNNGIRATEVTFESPSCLVIGNEEVGITQTNKSMGINITLPQKRSDISYNASVAASILFFLMSVQQKAM